MSARYKIGVDSMSVRTAEHFLADVAGHRSEDVTELSEAIQRTCEDFCQTVEERTVTVCSACFRASCWQGFFMCDDARAALGDKP